MFSCRVLLTIPLFLSEIKTDRLQTEVNKILEKVIQWANKNKPEVNYKKTSCLLIGKKEALKETCYQF